jgi:hypothetical protein
VKTKYPADDPKPLLDALHDSAAKNLNDLLVRLMDWHDAMGGWDNPVWRDLGKFLGRPTETDDSFDDDAEESKSDPALQSTSLPPNIQVIRVEKPRGAGSFFQVCVVSGSTGCAIQWLSKKHGWLAPKKCNVAKYSHFTTRERAEKAAREALKRADANLQNLSFGGQYK